MIRQGLFLAAAIVCGSASAQSVYKCVFKSGAITYQSYPCVGTTKAAKQWDATPEPPPTNAELWRRYHARQKAEADSRYLSRLAGTDGASRSAPSAHVITTRPSVQASDCAMAKAERDRQTVGKSVSYNTLRAWNDRVYEACK